MRGVDARRILDRRLDPAASAPLVVGFSGGGDSLALLLIAKTWADRRRRRLVALTVDHGLTPMSADWALWCAERANRLGVEHRTLRWAGPKPATGLPARARAARHRLLGDEARRVGAAVILLGHTADDLMEAAAMRAAGSTTPSPRDWSPVPVWPEGRGLFLLRPLLGERRAGLRGWLASRSETWIEDPANDDLRFARARARARVGADQGASVPADLSDPFAGAGAVSGGTGGELRLPADASHAVLAAALVSAGGSSRPPRGRAIERAMVRLSGGETVVLAGARAALDGASTVVCREPGELRRRGAVEVDLPPNEARVWDGRFEVEAHSPGLRVRPLAGVASRLPAAERAALKCLPAAVRGALPAIVFEDGAVTCPILARSALATARSLVLERFQAACGLIGAEAAIWRVAKAEPAS